MENQAVVLRNQNGRRASRAAPPVPILVKEPQCSGRTNQRTLLSNHNSCGLVSSAISSVKSKTDQGDLVSNRDTYGITSNAAVPVKSKVKTCLRADCISGGITVTLDNSTMWNEFYHRNTEMILTKQGRRMFPYCRYWITGLESNLKYILVMDISPVDNYRYKWNGHSWEPSGKAEPHVLGRVFIHPESPSTGHYWMHQPVSFYKLKLTNNTLDQEGHIILHSMHRYLPRLHLVPADKATEVIQLNGPDVYTFTFPQTEFFAVAAYQNIQITQLKIDYNPFKKGFLKDGLRSSSKCEAEQNGRSEHEGFPNNDRCPCSSEADILDPGQKGLNGLYNNQKMYNSDLKRESFNSDINEHDEPELKQETSEFPIANPCESDSHMKSLLNSSGDISVSIKEELVDDYVPNVSMERIQLKQKDINKETEVISCSDEDPILEKQLKKHSKTGKSHKQSHNSPLDAAKTKMLKLYNRTMPAASKKACEVTKSMVKISALQAFLSSRRTDKSFLKHSENSFLTSPIKSVGTKIKNLFSINNEEQECSLVKDVPLENIQVHNSHSIKQKPLNFKCISSAAAKLIVGEEKPNTSKKPVLSSDVVSNPSAVLSAPCRRGRPRKLKLSEVKQPLKYIRKTIMKNLCAPLRLSSNRPEFMLDLEDVDGVLFLSFESKETLNNHTIDQSGRTGEPLNEQAAIQFTCDSDCQERLNVLEIKLLEDLKSFRHKQVIHPNLQEVGLKLGSVDPTVSIDLKYLGVQLPLSSSKDRVFGNNQGTSSLDTSLSFISRTGKTDDFRKIKGWQEKFHNASRHEGGILEDSLKNRSAFCSDTLDDYLENEEKLMTRSMGFPPNFSSCPVVHQFSSESGNYVQAQQSIPKKKCTPPASYSFKPLSLPSFRRRRRRRRNINSKKASSRGSIKYNKSAVDSLALSEKQYRVQVLEDKVTNSQPNSKTDNTVNVLMKPDLDKNVQGKHRTVCQTTWNSHICTTHKKLMDLEGCVLRDGKPRTYITEERADFSLRTLFISQALLNNSHVCEVIRRPTARCRGNSCQLGSVCASLALETAQPTIHSETECTFGCLKRKMALIKRISIQKLLHGNLACCNGQEEVWQLEQMNKWERTNDDVYKAELEQSSINFPMWVKKETDTEPVYIPTPSATKSTKRVILPHSEVILPFNKLNSTYVGVKVEQVETPSSNFMFPGQSAISPLIQHTVSPMEENVAEKVQFGAVHLEEKKLHIQETEKLQTEMLDSKLEELLITQLQSHVEGIMCDRDAVTSGVAGKNTEMVKQLSSAVPVFQLKTVLQDHSYCIKGTAEFLQIAKLSEDTSDNIFQLDNSEFSEGNKNVDIKSVEELLKKPNILDIEIAAAHALPSRQLSFVCDHSDKVITPSKPSELGNNNPKGVAPAVPRDRSKHTEEERCRRKEIKELYEKLQVTLQLHHLPRVAKRVLLEKAVEEIQELLNQADKLMGQKKLLMRKQDILIRKASALSGKTHEVISKKLRYISAKPKAVEAQKQQQQQGQPVKAVETAETARPYVQDSPCSEIKDIIVSQSQEKPRILCTENHATENEDSFLMPRIVNVMSLATVEDAHLNRDINRDPYISLVIDSPSSKPSLPVVSQEINFQCVEKVDSSCGKERNATGTTQHFNGKKENSFSQIRNDSSLKESPKSFARKLCVEELAQSQMKEKQISRGRSRQQSKDTSFQELQVKKPKAVGKEMELQKVAFAVQEIAPDTNDLMDMNDGTDETLTSLLNEIAFLNQQLNDGALDVSEVPNSLSSCFYPGGMASPEESATANGSPFQFGPLGGSFKNLCLVQESSGSITPLLLHLEDDSITDSERTLGQPSSKPGVLKLMLGSEAKDPNLDLSTINIDGSGEHMEPLSNTTCVSPPILKMKTNLEPCKVDTIWKPMPKLAPFGLKPTNFPLDSGGQITKVMSSLAPINTKASSIGLKATQSVTNQEQD